jgi:hypothetical protein
MENERPGPFNLSAPNAVTNADFNQLLGRKLDVGDGADPRVSVAASVWGDGGHALLVKPCRGIARRWDMSFGSLRPKRPQGTS